MKLESRSFGLTMAAWRATSLLGGGPARGQQPGAEPPAAPVTGAAPAPDTAPVAPPGATATPAGAPVPAPDGSPVASPAAGGTAAPAAAPDPAASLGLSPEVLALCAVSGMSHAEAAEVLGCPVGPVKPHVLRGKEKLRDRLQSWQEVATR